MAEEMGCYTSLSPVVVRSGAHFVRLDIYTQGQFTVLDFIWQGL